MVIKNQAVQKPQLQHHLQDLKVELLKEEEPQKEVEEEEKKSSGGGGLGYLTSAFSRIGLSSLTAAPQEDSQQPQEEGTEAEQADTEDFFTSAMSKVRFFKTVHYRCFL